MKAEEIVPLVLIFVVVAITSGMAGLWTAIWTSAIGIVVLLLIIGVLSLRRRKRVTVKTPGRRGA
jgi:LPXTG-motif cell wall-anchored protein